MMKLFSLTRTTLQFSSALALLILVVAPSAFAAPGSGPTDITYTFAYWPNFLLFVGVFYLILRKPFLAAYEARRKEIEHSVTKGERELAVAKKRVEQVNKQLASLSDEVARLREQISKETELEVAATVRAAKEQAVRIEENAKVVAASERTAALVELENRISDEALRMAEQKLRTRVTAERDRRLREAALADFKQKQSLSGK